MNPKLKKRLVHLVGYPAFFIGAFAAMLFITFPFDALRGFARDKALAQGVDLTIGKLGLTLGGLAARDVTIRMDSSGGDGSTALPIRVSELVVAPRFFPLGVHASASLFGGRLDAEVTLPEIRTLKLRAQSLKLARVPSDLLGGVQIDGEVALLADLSLTPKDFAKTRGRVAALGEQLYLRQGSVSGFTLPRIDLGRLELDLDLANGKAQPKTARLTGIDLAAELTGDAKLGKKAKSSVLNLTVAFTPSEDFLKKNSLISAALGMAMKKNKEGAYEAKVQGTVTSPKVRPIK